MQREQTSELDDGHSSVLPRVRRSLRHGEGGVCGEPRETARPRPLRQRRIMLAERSLGRRSSGRGATMTRRGKLWRRRTIGALSVGSWLCRACRGGLRLAPGPSEPLRESWRRPASGLGHCARCAHGPETTIIADYPRAFAPILQAEVAGSIRLAQLPLAGKAPSNRPLAECTFIWPPARRYADLEMGVAVMGEAAPCRSV